MLGQKQLFDFMLDRVNEVAAETQASTGIWQVVCLDLFCKSERIFL
jgi:hypothetical protein